MRRLAGLQTAPPLGCRVKKLVVVDVMLLKRSFDVLRGSTLTPPPPPTSSSTTLATLMELDQPMGL